MKKRIKTAVILLALLFAANLTFPVVYANTAINGFELVKTQEITALGGTVYYYRHSKTGAEVVYLENGAQRLEFSIGFKTPPADSKGANHVLEHSLLCGSDKYPTKNVMHYMEQGTSSLITMGVTIDDCTYYPIKTENQTEYYNVIDVYMNGIFHPLLKRDENIFHQQGIRLEYVDGKVRYNGVVYNELRMKRLDTTQNSLSFLRDKLYNDLYGNTAPAFDSSGSIDDLKNLTYEDLMRVYNTYYVPSNSMTFIAGKQDISKTLRILDSFFMDFEKQEVHIAFQDTKRLPEEPISEYNITENTATVDIGFMFSGVPVYGEQKEIYARDIIFNIIHKKMNSKNPKNYVLGGNSGGISTLGLLISEVPLEQKEEIISAYNGILNQLKIDGIDSAELDSEIESYFADKKNPYTQSTDLKFFNSLLYYNDPFSTADITSTEEYFTNHKEYFNDMLKKYFIENPYHKTVISGNIETTAPDDTVLVNTDKLKRIQRKTEEFQAWADAPDAPSVIEQLPLLTLDEVKDAPDTTVPVQEESEGISFYHTEKNSEFSAGLLFPLAVQGAELNDIQLMCAFMTAQTRNAGLSNVYFSLSPMENYKNSKEINPHVYIGMRGADLPETFQSMIAFLEDERIWNTENLREYIQTEPEKLLKNSYQDPFYLSYELMQSAQSAGKSFGFAAAGSILQGSPLYYRFLKNIDPDQAPVILEKLKSLVHSLLLDNKPLVEYIGSQGYDSFKNTVIAQFKNTPQRESIQPPLPAGCYSAATITELEDANHFMLTGSYGDNDYSGKLHVLGKVLAANYLLPTLRGKYGAYGAGISFHKNNMVSSVTGVWDIDLTLDVWQGMGDYLRNLRMTQKELDAIIVSAIKTYDEYDYTSSEYGAQFALSKQSTEDLAKTREEMLSTTVEDLRNYADLIDSLTAQNRFFAVLSPEVAEQTAFPFAYYADANTLEIIPRWKESPQLYIKGKTDKIFAPDDYVTRGETAALITRLSADKRGYLFKNRFKDISPDNWCYSAVLSVAEKNIMSGYADNIFAPEKNITRAELAAVLSKFIFQGTTELKTQYHDISATAWYYEPLAKLINAGFIQGYSDGTLRPDAPVTRAEIVTILNRMLKISHHENKKSPFEDVTETHWAYQDIVAAAEGSFPVVSESNGDSHLQK